MLTEILSGWFIPMASRLKLTLREIVLFGILAALTFGLKVAMSGLPNIEPVSLMVMLFAVIFGWKALYPMYLYVAMEILFYGINLWSINYLYIWAVLMVAALLLKKAESPLFWATLSGAFGLLFGALCGIVDIFIGGVGYAVSKWISGIPFDIAHCVGNFVIALLLFCPLRRLLEKLYKKLAQ